MYLDALDHLAHDAVVVLCFIRIALGDDALNFLQPRLPRGIAAHTLLNCGNAAVKLLDLIGDAFEFILAAFYVFPSRNGFVDLSSSIRLFSVSMRRVSRSISSRTAILCRWRKNAKNMIE